MFGERMNNPIWIGSPIDVRHAEAASAALKTENDTQYWSDEFGIIKIDSDRWLKAQEYERDTWMRHATDASSDRDADHLLLFDNYDVLPHILGDTLEIGCGPFTQTRVILRDREASSITLLDPLLDHYKSHQHCAYSMLLPIPSLHAIPAEDLDDEAQFDIIICINVLEHVRDVNLVLNNIKRALRSGGLIVMGERTYDQLDITQLYDVGHPMRPKSNIIIDFMQQFDVIFTNNTQHQTGESCYFIGR